MIVYKALNKINGKVYVGQTVKSLKTRIGQHKNDKRGLCIVFRQAIQKYGIDNFYFDIVAWCDDIIKLNFLEKFYIDYFKSKVPNGYNLTDGGDGRLGFSHTEETKQKMSQAAMGEKNHNYRVPRPTEENKKRSDSLRGKLVGPLNPMYGNHRKLSEETKNRMRIAQNTPEAKRKKRERMMGDKNFTKREDVKEKLSKSITLLWQRRREANALSH